MKNFFAAFVCALLCAAPSAAQSPIAAESGKTIDVSLGYSYVSHGERLSSPIGLSGVETSITVGGSRLSLRADLAYARAGTVPGTGRHTEVLSYLAGPVFHPAIHRNFDTYVQVLIGAARVSGPVPLGGGAYLLGGWATDVAWLTGGGIEYRVTHSLALRTGVDYLRTSYFNPSLTLRGQNNLRSTATMVYCFEKRSRR